MPIADRYLAEDESLVYVTRQHWTTMVGEFLALCVIAAAAGLLVWWLPRDESWGAYTTFGVLAVAAIFAAHYWLIPLLRWRSTMYILTTKRMHRRSGFLSKTGRSIPLARVNDVSFRANPWERIMRYGTLNIQSASEQGMMTLRHVPDPEGLKAEIYRAVDALSGGPGQGPAAGPPAR